MLICTGLEDNLSNLVTTTIHIISTTDFIPDKFLWSLWSHNDKALPLWTTFHPTKLKLLKRLVLSIVKSVVGFTTKQRNYRETWSAGGSGNQTKQNQQNIQQNTGNQGSGEDKKKGKGCSQGKGNKDKGKANETYVLIRPWFWMNQTLVITTLMLPSSWKVYLPLPHSSLVNQENHWPQGSMMRKYLIGWKQRQNRKFFYGTAQYVFSQNVLLNWSTKKGHTQWPKVDKHSESLYGNFDPNANGMWKHGLASGMVSWNSNVPFDAETGYVDETYVDSKIWIFFLLCCDWSKSTQG